MTRTANARIAGFTYLFYAAIGICLELLMHRARSVDGDSAAKLASFGEHAADGSGRLDRRRCPASYQNWTVRRSHSECRRANGFPSASNLATNGSL